LSGILYFAPSHSQFNEIQKYMLIVNDVRLGIVILYSRNAANSPHNFCWGGCGYILVLKIENENQRQTGKLYLQTRNCKLPIGHF
jgi:hypothetical protein